MSSNQFKNRQRQFTRALKGRTIVKVKGGFFNEFTFHLDNGKR